MSSLRDRTTALAAARSAYPGIDITVERFSRFVEACTAANTNSDISELHMQDLYLACGCAEGNAAALALFEQRHLVNVGTAIARLGREPAFVDEVRQAVRTKLLCAEGGAPKIASYSGRGTLDSWVRAVAVRVGLNLLRRRKTQVPVEDLDRDPLLAAANPELEWIKHRYRQDFKEAFAVALASLTPEQRTIMRLHYLDEVSLANIGKLSGVHESTVFRRIEAAVAALLEGTRRELGRRLQLEPCELDSLINLLRSHLEISVRTLWEA
jgi:RNA polymerase sigma-70 factor (ECF subfamily)